MASQGYDFYGYEIRLMRDIDFDDEDFYPIGTYDVHFNGTLNGNGYRIKNMNMKFSNYTGIGFIGYLGCNGVVKDLTINSSCVVEGYTNVGAIAGCNCGGKILNCSSYADVYANGSYVGGIVGYNGVNGRVINCSVWAYADIRSGNGCYEGRFIGQNDGFNPKNVELLGAGEFKRGVEFSMSIERTYIMLKPDCLKRGLVGEVISRIEKRVTKLQILSL